MEQHQPGLPVWVKLVIVAALGVVTVAVVPRVVDSGGLGPPVGLLVGVGALVAVISSLGMYLAVRQNLRLSVAAALYAVGFNVLVVAVKFVYSPFGVYEYSESAPIETLLPVSEAMGAVLIAAMMFLLYAAAYWIIYRMVRRKVAVERPPRRLVIVLVVVVSVVLGGIVTGYWILALVAFGEGLNYLTLVFSSTVSLFAAASLVGAIALVTLCFRETRGQAQALSDASLLMGMFWLGLAFLALYHVLWVVYLLVLTTLWPLRVVTPK